LSLIRDFYYEVKPLLPFPVRMGMRRLMARIQLRNSNSRWPILSSAGTAPRNWTGWPNGKQFALVLTHDVESPVGLANCERLMKLEMELGFRSSFNFIPEGSYKVSSNVLGSLVERGFEVGVHDLHHNGKLYRNKKRFQAAAPRINQYLHDWNAVGFRSGFMHRNLEWLHALDIEYDMSTFDTDPFEPQPDGVETIFPFFLSDGNGGGYAELPYTLPQDSTLFLLLKEKNISVWKRKLDWIVARGGMALVNVHPDYISFDGSQSKQFPASFYRELLVYIKDTYGEAACHLLPREVAAMVQSQNAACMQLASVNLSD
jgi:hypothetical protein